MTVLGITEQVSVGDDGVQPSVTVPVTPGALVRTRPKYAVPPGTDVAVEEPPDGIVTTTGDVIAVPVSATVCGLPVALSAMLSVAVRVPAAAGVNVTATEQFAPAASEPVGLQVPVPSA